MNSATLPFKRCFPSISSRLSPYPIAGKHEKLIVGLYSNLTRLVQLMTSVHLSHMNEKHPHQFQVQESEK